jgi:hypothetical protein
MTDRVTLPEPIEIAKFWKNRSHDAIVVCLRSYEGRNFLDVRTHRMQDGKLLPSHKGVTIAIPRIPEFTKAINDAMAKAKELGLIVDQGEAGK